MEYLLTFLGILCICEVICAAQEKDLYSVYLFGVLALMVLIKLIGD